MWKENCDRVSDIHTTQQINDELINWILISATLSREKSKLAFLEPGGSASLSKTLPTTSLQSMLQQQTSQTSPVPSSIHSISTPTLQLAGAAQTFGCGSSSSQVGPSTQLLVGPQPPAPPPPAAKASCGGAEGDSQSADNQRYWGGVACVLGGLSDSLLNVGDISWLLVLADHGIQVACKSLLVMI